MEQLLGLSWLISGHVTSQNHIFLQKKVNNEPINQRKHPISVVLLLATERREQIQMRARILSIMVLVLEKQE